MNFAKENNVSFFRLFADDRFKDNKFVNEFKEQAVRRYKQQETMNKIIELLRDSHIAQNCYVGIEKLRRAKVPKRKQKEYVKLQLELLEYSSFKKSDKDYFRRMIKSHKKHLIDMDRRLVDIPKYDELYLNGR